MTKDNSDRFADPIICSSAVGPLSPINPLRSSAAKCCRNCRFWATEHGYMDCAAPDVTAWDVDGNCDGWQPKDTARHPDGA